MKISDALIKMAISAHLVPENANLSGPTTLGLQGEYAYASNIKAVLSARLAFSAAAQTATFTASTGALALSATGTAQVETCTVVAPSGCTANGYLLLTLTAAGLTPSNPLNTSVPLSTRTHTTAALIAAAIAEKLNTLSSVTDRFTVTAVNANVVLTSRYGLANDTTLNLAITAGYGVTAVTTSTNTTAGVAGVLVQRAGGDAKDIFGGAWPSGVALFRALAIKGVAGTSFVGTTALTGIDAASFGCRNSPYGISSSATFTANGEIIADVAIFC